MKKLFIQSCFVSILVTVIPVCALAQASFFSNKIESSLAKAGQKRVIIPDKYRTLQLDTATLLQFLRSVPSERNTTNRSTTPIMALPMPDGTTATFHIWESSAMSPELATRFPNLKTYTGQGITDPTATLKLDWTELGFHAQILSPVTTAVYIDPYAQGTLTNYISYYKKDFKKKDPFTEGTPINTPNVTNRFNNLQSEQCIGRNLRTYRLAVACTGEYAVAATGIASPTRAQALSAIVTTVNRVDGIYEKELDLRLVLVDNEDSVVYTDASTDPFNGNNNASTLIGESQTVIDNRIGSVNYDMGHTFSTGGGGLSQVGVTCQTGSKAKSITGSSVPVGDPYDIDYVAHEMGHSLGANHPFNSVTGNCSGNGSTVTNTEPGSGSTIMAYAGICGSDDLQPHSDPQFQAINLDEISSYIFNSTGNTCGTLTATGNTPPVVNAGANYTIPKSTPFVLTGSATDTDGDILYYSWEEIDKGGPFGPWNAPSGNAPLFRSFQPVATPVRYFPKLSDELNNTTTIGETLPSYARTMRFRLTARDNKAGGGGVCFDSTSIKVDGTASPFVVTSPTATGIIWYVNDFKTITWDASTTALAPINCANVTIQLSTDGGNTFPITLLASTPNDGTEEIQVPNNISTTARIRVMAVSNIFYDISNFNFTVQASPTADFVFNTPDTLTNCGSNNPSVNLKTGSLGGFITAITLTASNMPPGTTVSFGVNPLMPGSNTMVMLNNTNNLANGSYTVTVTGTAMGAPAKTRNITFIIGNTLSAPASLTAPTAYAIGVDTLPTFTWAAVPGATSYILEISSSPGFASIIQSVSNITTTSYTLTTALAENITWYWRVKTANTCGIGLPSAASLFKTGVSNCNMYTSTDVPKTISAFGASTITSTLVIPVASGVTISDVNVVGLAGTHTWTGDLTATIKSPAGSNVILFDQVCSNTPYQNFNVNFDDEVNTTIPCNFIGGITVMPSQPLSALKYQASTGTWTLVIKDNYDGDGGMLTGWGLRICSFNATPITYTFTGNGAWSNPANWSDNTTPPAILPANCAIDINPVLGGQCILNITQHISANARLTIKSGKMIVVLGSVIIQ